MNWESFMVALGTKSELSRRAALQAGATALFGFAADRGRAEEAPLPKLPADPPQAIRRPLPIGGICSTPADAVRVALHDACEIANFGDDPTLTRYVWIPDWIEPQSGLQQVGHVINSTLTRVATRPRPRLLQEGKTAVVAIDLEKYAAKSDQVPEIVALYERLAARDSWFNAEVVIVGDQVVEVVEGLRAGQAVEIKLTNGKWAAATFKSREGSLLICDYQGKLTKFAADNVRSAEPAAVPLPIKRAFTAHAYLNPEGVELFELTRSDVPIMRLDEWVAFTFSSVNGGLYYELAGVGKTLGDTVAKFAGFAAAKKVLRQAEALRLAQATQRKEGGKRSILEIAAEFDGELAKSRCVMNESAVTRRQRAFLFVAGSNVAPADGMQLVAVTYDLAEDNTATDADPQRNLAVYETYNGGEAILAMPNGMLLYLVFDAQDNIIDRVPDNVTYDSKAASVRANAGTARVFSGVSCANCHEATERNYGWQPVTNDIAATLRSVTRLIGDRGKPGKPTTDKLQLAQRLAAGYAADDEQLLEMMIQARLPYQRAVSQATTAKVSRDVVRGLADSYWGYWCDAVFPEHAVMDLAGLVLSREDAQAYLLQHVEANPDAELAEILREDAVLDRLKRGRSVVPAQWRAIAPNTAERHLVHQANHPVPPEGEKNP